MNYTKENIPRVDNLWWTEFGWMMEEDVELYILELNNGVYE